MNQEITILPDADVLIPKFIIQIEAAETIHEVNAVLDRFLQEIIDGKLNSNTHLKDILNTVNTKKGEIKTNITIKFIQLIMSADTSSDINLILDEANKLLKNGIITDKQMESITITADNSKNSLTNSKKL